ncbi:indolepyruvate oxidoreductase subunit beta [Thermodesulfobacteriota bacterium]
MNAVNLILCGLGGQGILFMTRIIAQASLDKGNDVMGAETHGMAQRGGSVVSHLKIGKAESSLVMTGSAQYLISLDEDEGYRNLPFLSKGAEMFVNANQDKPRTEEIEIFLDKYNVTYHAAPAWEIAKEFDAPMSSNLALLGFFSAFVKRPVDNRDLRKTIENISPDRFKEINLKVFDAGFEEGSKKAE